MKLWKKGLTVVSATVLAASLPLYSEAASNVTVKGKVWPKAGISLNFDSVEFNGTVGELATSVYKSGDTTVTTPQISVRYKDNFNVGVKSAAFTGTDASNNVITLDTKRLKVSTTTNEATSVPVEIQLTSLAQDILKGTGDGTAAQSLTKPLEISLDLAETGYTDPINTLSSQANLNATITISYNGL